MKYLTWDNKIFLFVGLIMLVFIGNYFPSHLHASSVLYVAPNGSNSSSCIQSEPCSLQYAVDIAGAGDRIILAAGVYTSTADAVLTVQSKGDLTLEGPGTNATNGTTVTLDGENTRRVIRALASGTLTITGLVIQNGYVASGLGSESSAFGAGILADKTALVLSDVKFVNNRVYGEDTGDIGGAASGGGLAMRLAPTGTTSRLSYVVFDDNQAIGGTGANRGGYAVGGGLYTFNTVINIDHITFTNNRAIGGSSTGSGDKNGKADALGGAYSAQVGTIATINVLTATNNIAQGGAAINAGGAFGGALFSEGLSSTPTSVTIYDAVITNNHAFGANGIGSQGNGGHAAGGGVQFDKSSITIERSYITDNEAIGGDGANQNGPAGGGGLYFQNLAGIDVWVTVKNTIVADNLVRLGAGSVFDGGGGGGIWVQCIPHMSIIHTTIANNRLENQGQGEGWTQGSAFNIGNDGCSSNNTSNVDIKHSIITGHSESYALWVKQNNTASLHKIMWSDNKANTNEGGFNPGVIIDDGTSFEVSSVQFLPNSNYHLSSQSPAKDAATDSSTTDDIDSDIRPYNTYADIGADEFYPDAANLSNSTKVASLATLFSGQTSNITYTIKLNNTGTADVSSGHLVDIPPVSGGSLTISPPGNLQCDSGNCYIDNGQIIWNGTISSGMTVDIQYILNINIPTSYTNTTLITNSAQLVYTDTESNNDTVSLSSIVVVNPKQIFLPLVMK